MKSFDHTAGTVDTFEGGTILVSVSRAAELNILLLQQRKGGPWRGIPITKESKGEGRAKEYFILS